MTTQHHFCISENRVQDEVGVKLVVLSLVQNEPDCILHLFIDDLSEELKSWARDFPQVVLEQLTIKREDGWNIKAKILTKLLNDGVKAPIWIDSDIIVTAPIGHFFALEDDEMLVAEEFFRLRHRGTAGRTRGWGLPVGRNLPFTPNSCVVRVTDSHREFLNAWQELIRRPDYVALQAGPWNERPFYMMGDQDAMSALLGSEAFSHVPVRYLRKGRDIAQCFGADGYSPLDRLRNWQGLPPFVHAQGAKPWRKQEQIFQTQVDAFWYAARDYRNGLTEDESGWLDDRSKLAKLLHCMFLGHSSYVGLPSAICGAVGKYCGTIARKLGMPRQPSISKTGKT
ncbi:hypothetical protein [Blastopirellula marina]|uniref:Nucleotide-diphospho-sugar transferase domain-containing protein n=1 Tax=Blastopirellula marina TaxID=124 RepID=A0A2S8FA07_9BACT|nr:hypothetical protein [Blastopirellula marina]PQO28774.1 hypothetical protein C5Y98_23635 [Blastopirellula marina]PTL42047.1 hypothetical protein C5Y97_23650 [Blastopirellula marina]